MPKAQRDTAVYRRGKYWLDWDRRSDGSLRTPFLTTFWYDPGKRRTCSASTGTADVQAAMRHLDAHYVTHETGQAICPTCGQLRQASSSYLVTEAIESYLAVVEGERTSGKAISSRLAVVLEYIATLPDPNIQAVAIDEAWIAKFRKWAAKQPKRSVKGKALGERSLSTIETYVTQLAAAINEAHRSKKILAGANFKPIPFKQVNRTPQHRSDVEELAAMFCYAQGYPELHRFLALSVATLCRPDAAHDFNAAKQWRGKALELNPPLRLQTKKYRPTVPPVKQIVPALEASNGWFVGVKSVRRQWEKMAAFVGLPEGGEAGTKLVRRSVANLLRNRLPIAFHGELKIWLGHERPNDEMTALYAPFSPDYLCNVRRELESIIEEIERFVPQAYTGLAPEKPLTKQVEFA